MTQATWPGASNTYSQPGNDEARARERRVEQDRFRAIQRFLLDLGYPSTKVKKIEIEYSYITITLKQSPHDDSIHRLYFDNSVWRNA